MLVELPDIIMELHNQPIMATQQIQIINTTTVNGINMVNHTVRIMVVMVMDINFKFNFYTTQSHTVSMLKKN